MNGDLGPGEQIRQQVWAERCGVSRPPVREALEILTNAGLLMHSLNQGYFVAKYSIHEMHQLYTMRRLLEQEAIRTLEWPDPEQLEAIRNRASLIEPHVKEGRPDLAMQDVVAFFLDVYRLSPSNLIVAEIERLWTATASYRSRNYDVVAAPQGSTMRFEQIIVALAACDREQLAELMDRPTRQGLQLSRGASQELEPIAETG
ncbi:GntR family transcriptional regulator [Rhodococcus sp. ABRD24]|uniref:GntR family transcriptional regulator n=1 Tax=Rhodococcus sp. ABRD24 TaxID=2507582 RepID=UPI0013F161EE|nr:GntR family transcriptional regulator [Rhodococcus sp. ABRD24]